MFAYLGSGTDQSRCAVKSMGEKLTPSQQTWTGMLEGVGWLLIVLQMNQISRTFTCSSCTHMEHRGEGNQLIIVSITAYFCLRGK